MSEFDQDFLEQLKDDFLMEAGFLLEQCEESYLKLDDAANRAEELAKIFRLAHSMKGGGSAVGFADLAAFAHVVEDTLSFLRAHPEMTTKDVISLLLRASDAFKLRVEQLKIRPPVEWDVSQLTSEFEHLLAKLTGEPVHQAQAPASAPVGVDALAPVLQMKAETEKTAPRVDAPAAAVAKSTSQAAVTIKVDAEKIESILNLVGELVVIKSQLLNQVQQSAPDLALNSIVSLLDKTIREMQDQTLSLRLTPLKPLFVKSQRVVRDLSVKLNKPVDFIMKGDETEIDRSMVEALTDPLLHLMRNAIDHGIESEEERVRLGKKAQATITLGARAVGSRIVLEIRDDGKGIQRDRVLKKALSQGMLDDAQAATMTDSQVYALLFAPGFSTAEVVSDVSGRGVGLDVVRTNIEKLKGSIDVVSKVGTGTSFFISVPLTTAITDGIILSVAGHPYIVPIESIQEMVHAKQIEVTQVGQGDKIARIRDRLLPYVDLQDHVGLTKEAQEDRVVSGMVLVVGGQNPLALNVERIIGQTQVVVKALGDSFAANPYLTGAAILGDGRVAMVLDPESLGRSIASTQAVMNRDQKANEKSGEAA